jgi:hypothetical protein
MAERLCGSKRPEEAYAGAPSFLGYRIRRTYFARKWKLGDAGKSILIMTCIRPFMTTSIGENPLGPRPRGYTRLRLTRTAIPSPTSRTGCASPPN